MKITTRIFGEVEIDESKIISFPSGIIGFPGMTDFALIYDEDDNIIDVFKVKEELITEYNVSLFKRPKNMKNFFEKVKVVANLVTSVKDKKENKEIKVLQ